MKKLFLIIGFVGLSLVFTMASEAADIEAVTADNTVNSGFSVKEGTGSTTLMRVRGDGKVGIGTDSPGDTLQIGTYAADTTGTVRLSVDHVQGFYQNEANPRWELNRNMGGADLAGIGFGPGGATAIETKIWRTNAYQLRTNAYILTKDSDTATMELYGGTDYNKGGCLKLLGNDKSGETTNVEIFLNGTKKLDITQTDGSWIRVARFWGGGGVRVGNTDTDPGANNLAVDGTAQMTGFQLGTSTTAGYVLTAAASGVGTWAAAAGGNDPRLIMDALTTGEQFDVANSTTLVEITNLSQTLAAGTYTFQYFVIYRSNNTLGGIRYAVNYSGTNGAFVYWFRWSDILATASSAAPKQAISALPAGQCLGSFANRAKGTTSIGTTLSVDLANSDMFMIIEGVFVATDAGDLELWTASEVSTAGYTTSTMIGTSVIINKTK